MTRVQQTGQVDSVANTPVPVSTHYTYDDANVGVLHTEAANEIACVDV